MAGVSRQPRVRDTPTAWQPAATPCLLDVNVLIALLDSLHPFHRRAHTWFKTARQAWASCNLSENGALRILSHPKYRNVAATPAEVAHALAELCALPGHHFWPADVSLLDSPLIDTDHLLHANQITDSYLLALAVQHHGCLATFDARLVTSAVKGGRKALLIIE